MENYTGNTSNKNDLTDSNNFYKGEQDDDDFEKLIIKPVKKQFDLELVKFIAAVSKDAKIDEGEYLTDTKKSDGIYTRAPKISIETDESKQDTNRKIKCDWSPSNKEPLLVDPGDYVLYTIRVYNAGEVDGYASLIKDLLPVGLEFVETTDQSAEYYGIWNIDKMTDENGDEREVISTEHLAKGKEKELNSVQGDANYTANLLRALDDEKAVSNVEPKNPDYRDVQVLCRVKEQTNKTLVNYAQISADTDKDGNEITDKDSTPDNLPKDGPHEDDEDLEKIKVRTPDKYGLVLVKEDKDGKQLNSTAEFEVTTNGKTETKKVTGRLTIAENVPVDADHLTDDVYVIKETKAPDDYCRFDGTITITVSKKQKADGTGYEKTLKYTVVDSKGNDITSKKDANVYLNEDGNIYVEVKNYEEPEIHKGVKDVTNQDSGYNADEVHTWVIESDIPSNLDDYKLYDIVDDIDYRLKFEGTGKVVVKIGNTTLKEGTDYKISFVENANGVQNKTTSGKLTLTFLDTENGMNASTTLKNNQGKKIQVTFNTTFAKDENGNLLAAMGEQIPNQAKLEYINTSSDNKVTKESEKPEVHTGGIVLYKYYELKDEKHSLEGAKFGIYATEEDAKNNKNVIMTATSDKDGLVKFVGLKYGEDAKDSESNKQQDGTYKYDADKASTKYWVAEIEAPLGYSKYNEVIEVTINKDSYNEKKPLYEVKNNRLVDKYNLVLVKEDKNGEQLNSTAEFEITTNGKTETKKVTGRLTIAENVIIDVDHLADDVYVIKETKAPDDYCRFDGTITITVSKKQKADGTGYEKTLKYTVVDSKGNDITSKKDANVYLNEDGNIYVEVKNYEEPEIHKGVKDVTNQDSGYNADEVHTWVIESDIPSNLDDYKLYDIVDDIDYRLKFEGTGKVVVKIGNTTLKEGTDYKISFVENANGVQNKTTSGKLTLTFLDTENGMNASTTLKNNQGKKIQVTFNTTFAKDENGNLLAAMGEQIPNQAKLEYINTSSDNKVTKESEKPEVHTGGIVLYKYYELKDEKHSLEGAKFGIYATEEDAKNNKNVIMTATSDKDGLVKFVGLKYGEDAKDSESNKQQDGTYKYDADKASTKYWIAEIEAPNGYEKSNEIMEVTINKDSYNEKKPAYEVKNNKLNFDLALRKFITKVQDTEVTTRIPQVKYENGQISYEHTKEPLVVHVNDIVIYTLRIFNEGDIDGYASEITDDIPDYLEYLPVNETNTKYLWKMYDEDGNETQDVSKAVKVKTTYLSKDNEKTAGENLLKAFDGNVENISYKDIKIAFKVKDPNSNTYIITNHAQISDDSDKDGKPIDDIDSIPDEWNEGEDDQDVEHVKVEYFDLALLKYVTKAIIIENGQERITETGYNGLEDPEPVVKVEINRKQLNNVIVKFAYGIKITNEGDIPGYAKEITDYVPSGLRFEAADNPGWTDEGNNVISTRLLEGTLLQPGESAVVEVVLTWINGADNLGEKTNTAEISEDYNDHGDVPDRDSTPDNQVPGEDDIDIAKVILTISTGIGQTFFGLTIGLLSIVLIGVILIKKFVL